MTTPKVIHSLTGLVRFLRVSEPRSRFSSQRRQVAIGTALCLAASVGQISQSQAATNTDYLKLYLHVKIVNFKQFHCAIDVAHRESRWNPSARNGSHYGLFQMRNKKVERMNPYTQIDWWLRYVNHRYKGKACLALDHLRTVGWQ